MKIPIEVYDRVLELATQLTNATEAQNTRDFWIRYNELREFCESVTDSGSGHPFLWESLADFTDNDRAAIALYERALHYANDVDAAPYRASINIALAERYERLGNLQLSRQHALAANENAKLLDDLAVRTDVSELLLRLATHN
jgi:hypothetical protein